MRSPRESGGFFVSGVRPGGVEAAGSVVAGWCGMHANMRSVRCSRNGVGMTSATLLIRPVAPAAGDERDLICVACFGPIGDASDTGLYCAHCACHRCGEDAAGSGGHDGYCEHCAPALDAAGFFG